MKVFSKIGLFRFVAVSVAALALGGCKFFDDENCKTPLTRVNLKLHFSNTDNNGNDIFSSSVSKAEIFLFNDVGRLVYRFEATPAELAASRTKELSVEPGTYRVVCWGNAHENTSIVINDGDHFDNGYIFKQTRSGELVRNGNPLYYAPYDRSTPQTFTVAAEGAKEVDVRFRAAHIKLDFTILNYVPGVGDPVQPYIEVTSLYPKYDFNMNYLPISPLNYIQQTVAGARADAVGKALFNTPRFENDNPILIHIKSSPTSSPIKTLVLKDELAAQGIDVTAVVELTLPFEIDFRGTGAFNADVNIKIEGWKIVNGLEVETQN